MERSGGPAPVLLAHLRLGRQGAGHVAGAGPDREALTLHPHLDLLDPGLGTLRPEPDQVVGLGLPGHLLQSLDGVIAHQGPSPGGPGHVVGTDRLQHAQGAGGTGGAGARALGPEPALQGAGIEVVDRHVGPAGQVDELGVSGHLRQQDEALGDEDQGLVAPKRDQGLQGLAEPAERRLDAALRRGGDLLAEEAHVRLSHAHHRLVAGLVGAAASAAGDPRRGARGGGRAPRHVRQPRAHEPADAVLVDAHRLPVGDPDRGGVAHQLALQALHEGDHLLVLPRGASGPAQGLPRREDGQPVSVPEVLLDEADEGVADELRHRPG